MSTIIDSVFMFTCLYTLQNVKYMKLLYYNENWQSQYKHCQNCYIKIMFCDWSTRLFQQSPLYDLRLTGSSKTRSVTSLLTEIPS